MCSRGTRGVGQPLLLLLHELRLQCLLRLLLLRAPGLCQPPLLRKRRRLLLLNGGGLGDTGLDDAAPLRLGVGFGARAGGGDRGGGALGLGGTELLVLAGKRGLGDEALLARQRGFLIITKMHQ